MKTQDKEQIAKEVIRLAQLSSQNRIAKRAGVSSATISQIINGNWKLIKDSMWKKLSVKLRIDDSWSKVETGLFKKMYKYVYMAKKQSTTLAFSHHAGTGKTTFFTFFRNEFEDVIYIEGTRTMGKKTFLKRLLNNVGLEAYGTTEELYDQFVDHVSGLDEPIIINDQFDKLKDGTFDLFMDLYNDLFNSCGFILSGVPALEKRIRLGVQRKKIGYEEIWSRMNRKYIELPEVDIEDVQMIFQANGVDDVEAIHESFNCCDGDLRRVRQDVIKYHLNNK